MRIGVNITALQSGHRMRGIGSVVINFINNIDASDRKQHDFVFYLREDKDVQSALDLLNLSDMTYTIEYLKTPQLLIKSRLPGMLNLPISLVNKAFGLARLRVGQSLQGGRDIDCYLHTNQSDNMPRGHDFRKVMIAYDIIPYVMEWDYLHSYKTALLRGKSRSEAIRSAMNRWSYKKRLKINIRRADQILAISTHTANDYSKYLKTPKSKLEVQLLGVSPADQKMYVEPEFRYIDSSWDYFKRKYKFDNSKFLLYVGGADPRRRLDDLVTAFNLLRAEGQDIKLVLTGDTLQGPKNISTLSIQYALSSSSYLDDIIFLGFVDEDVKNWLYKNALAFVYPSLYEGFGLPVLEAMIQGCPVVCYDNAAVREVAGDAPFYAEGPEGIRRHALNLLAIDSKQLAKIQIDNNRHAQRFSWAKTSRGILRALQKS